MQRILVIDESEVIRETLALILGREFVIIKRPQGAGTFSFADSDTEVDLLILGLSPAIGVESSSLVRFAARVPFAVLFLVDSRLTAKAIEEQDKVGCLAKPFNPFELKEKVGRLLARRNTPPLKPVALSDSPEARLDWLAFPYLGRAAATLAPRFGASRLPLLITGEMGCGQERVARAIHALRPASPVVSVHAVEINADYLARKSVDLSGAHRLADQPGTLLIEDVEKLTAAGQSALLNFLDDDQLGRWRLLSTARADLLEQLYQGKFLDALYYKLATLTLKLAPLRDRKEDIPAIAGWFARFYAKSLGRDEAMFSAEANERLSNYLWFGNLHEIQAAVARTVVLRRKPVIQAADLVFDFSSDSEIADGLVEEAAPQPAKELKPVISPGAAPQRVAPEPGAGNGHGKPSDMNLVIHELAHELKNPMVTIKTFAQLLGDRYHDEDFRSRFQDIVGGDIDRMDDLLETLIEFADFAQPNASKVPLEEKLKSAVAELSEEGARRQVGLHWKGNGHSREVRTDEAQLRYILRNVLLAALAQAKASSEIEIRVEGHGAVAISYVRDGARVASIARYLAAVGPDENTLPLRILLAKQLVERNGGRMTFDQSDDAIDTVRMEFPIA